MVGAKTPMIEVATDTGQIADVTRGEAGVFPPVIEVGTDTGQHPVVEENTWDTLNNMAETITPIMVGDEWALFTTYMDEPTEKELQLKREITRLEKANKRLSELLTAKNQPCSHQDTIPTRCFPVAGSCSVCVCIPRVNMAKYKVKDEAPPIPYSAYGQLFRCCHCEKLVPFQTGHKCTVIGVTDQQQKERKLKQGKKKEAKLKKQYRDKKKETKVSHFVIHNLLLTPMFKGK